MRRDFGCNLKIVIRFILTSRKTRWKGNEAKSSWCWFSRRVRRMNCSCVSRNSKGARTIPEIKGMEVKFERSNIRQTVEDAIIGLSLILVARVGVEKDLETLWEPLGLFQRSYREIEREREKERQREREREGGRPPLRVKLIKTPFAFSRLTKSSLRAEPAATLFQRGLWNGAWIFKNMYT